MTKEEEIQSLTELTAAAQDVQWMEERLQWQRERMTLMRRAGLTDAKTKGGKRFTFDDVLERLEAIEDEYLERIQIYTERITQARELLDSIHDKTIQQFVRMRFMEGRQRKEICIALDITEWKYRTINEKVDTVQHLSDL